MEQVYFSFLDGGLFFMANQLRREKVRIARFDVRPVCEPLGESGTDETYPPFFAVGAAHHVTQRGNGRQDVFLNDSLRRVYVELLSEHASRNRLRVLAYFLMSNHVHLVVVPEAAFSLANTFRRAHGRFSQYWNTEFQRVGHLWQNRFYSCPIETSRVWRVVRYVEQNPVRAGMVETALEYSWSSAGPRVGTGASLVLDMGNVSSVPGFPIAMRPQMRMIERTGKIAALSKMPGSALTSIEVGGVTSVNLFQGKEERGGPAWNENPVDMVRHEAIANE